MWMIPFAAAAALSVLPGAIAKPPAFGPSVINQAIQSEWKRHSIVPAPPADDARFLRRAFLDITGTIPSAEVTASFLADRSPDKRTRLISELLESPRYAEYWAQYWDNVMIGKMLRNPLVDRAAFRDWLRNQFAQNSPWNRMAFDIIAAQGINSTGGSYARMAGGRTAADKDRERNEDAGKVNGAVNFVLKSIRTPADLSGNVSRIFMGVQIQCAQCHDHKTEKWTQNDFRKFTACFTEARPVPIEARQGGIQRVELRDTANVRRMPKKLAEAGKEYQNQPPTALDGTDLSSSPVKRRALAEWITAPQNRWFAEALVNRMWAHFTGRGFVEPIDDFRPSNPALMPELLKQMADDFVAHGYDLKHLIRTITATQVYQLSSAPAKVPEGAENTYWSRYKLKPMGPEVLLDSLVKATGLEKALEKVAGDRLDQLKFGLVRQFTFLFDVDEEGEAEQFEGTIPQALMLLNGNLVSGGTSGIPGTALDEVKRLNGTDTQKIEALYLRTVNRKPTTLELSKWQNYIASVREVVTNDTAAPAATGRLRAKALKTPRKQAPGDALSGVVGRMLPKGGKTPKDQAMEDIFWALLNSSEFLFNH
jgi:hypothetical protein